jgi:hypothetical protein
MSASRSIGPLLLLALVACPAEDTGTFVDLDALIRVNDASEEVLLTIVDHVDNGDLVIDDALAAAIVSPEPGGLVPAGTPAVFAWAIPTAARKTPRHGLTSGDFVWLRIEGGGLAAPIDVIAVDATSWTPDAATWATISAASSPLTLTLTNAFVDRGIVVEGPFRGTGQPTTFSISAE